MNIHYIQHVAFEDMATIENWAMDRRHSISKTRLYNGGQTPELEEFEWLVIMGGPMNIYEHETHPWLVEEKEFIRLAIAQEKIAWGIYLGAQLIADVLGGEFTKTSTGKLAGITWP